MNGYDFDKTILHGNTVNRFWWYCAVRFPYLWLLLPLSVFAVLFWVLHIISYDSFLRMMEVFEMFVPNRKKQAAKFWDRNQKHIKQWYLAQKREDDVIVSASPDYLIGEICSRLGVRFVATKTNKCGLSAGKHCYGVEKVREFQKAFPDVVPDSYYSDSMSDTPMFRFARNGFRVRGSEVSLVFRNGEQLPKK